LGRFELPSDYIVYELNIESTQVVFYFVLEKKRKERKEKKRKEKKRKEKKRKRKEKKRKGKKRVLGRKMSVRFSRSNTISIFFFFFL
jgi:hypothetical protein